MGFGRESREEKGGMERKGQRRVRGRKGGESNGFESDGEGKQTQDYFNEPKGRDESEKGMTMRTIIDPYQVRS